MNDKTIKKEIEKILKKMGISAKVIIEKQENSPLFNIETQEAGLLIGPKGENLAAFQHLVQVICNKNMATQEEIYRFSLDVNSYRKNKLDQIKEMVQYISQKVLKNRQAEILRPMNAYERRIVHLELSDHQDLITESVGEGINRRVIIRLKNK